MKKQAGLVCAIVLAIISTISLLTVSGQTSDPSTLPLLASDGLEYVGGFRLPAESVNGDTFEYGGQPMAFNPATNSLFIGNLQGHVAEVTIPTPVNSGDVNALPVATYLQPFFDPTEGHLRDILPTGVGLSSLMVYNNRLHGTATIYYDGDYLQHVSHYSRSLQLSQPSFSGWSQVGEAGRSGYVSGWMSPVPSEWQGRLGGAALTGQCCIPIMSRTSFGPAAFAFDPAQVGQPTVPATPLVYYNLAHSTLGEWDGSNPTFGLTTGIAGMVVVAGTRTLLYIGSNGLGTPCYGNGTATPGLAGTFGPDGAIWCYDPTSSAKGNHSYPYRYQVWAYDLNDLAAVKAGTKQPWDVVPYAVWPIDLPTPAGAVSIGAVAYDAQQQLLYVSQMGADPDGYAQRPVIHVFHANASGAPGATKNLVSNVTLTADKTAPQVAGTPVTFTAQPAGGVAPYQYKWIVSDGSATTTAAAWNASNQVTWTPATANANYRISVWVRSAGNSADVLEASTTLTFPITAATAPTTTSVALTANRPSPQVPMTAITWTATPTGGVAPHEYKWRIFDGATWTVGAWSPTNAFVWTPSSANANYRVEVGVRSAGNTADMAETIASGAFPIVVPTPVPTPPPTPPQAAAIALTSSKASPQPAGTTISFIATPSGVAAPYLFKWFVSDGSSWSTIGGWTPSQKLNWSRSLAGNYRIRVWVKSASNTADVAEAESELAFVTNAR